MTSQFRFYLGTALAGVLLALPCAPAFAQALADSAAGGLRNEDNDGQNNNAQPLADDIVVTGSRIARSGTTTSTPTEFLGEEDILNAGAVSPGDLVRQLPAIAPGVNNESSGVSFNAVGLDLVDLRNLGTNRTLVLVNGRRQVGSNPSTTAVDLNTIPTQMIERVEVITGGASAVYGADAVSGVMNVILKRDFEGLQFDAQGGVSSRGDGARYSISALGGSNFADGRGNAMAYVGYTREGGIDYDGRPGGLSGRNYVTNPASRTSSDGIPDYIIMDNVRQLGGQQESMFLLNPGGGTRAFGFNADGSPRPFALGPSGLINGGQYTDGGEAELGYDAQCPQAKCPLRVPLERYLISAAAHYELNDSADLFFEGRFAGTEASTRFGSVFEIPPTTNRISVNNPYVSPSLRTLMQQSGVTSIQILRSDQELGLRGGDADRRLFQLVGGLRGALGFGDFRYEAALQYGSTRYTNTRVNDVDQTRFLAALDAVRDPDGVIRCRDLTARSQGCVPINFLQPGRAISDASLNYIKIPFATETAELNQFVASGNLAGSIGNFWGAGAIQVAAGLEYRREESDYQVSPVDQAGQGFFFTRRQSTAGSFDVFEVFGEIVVPLLSDVPLVKRLEIEGAVRHSDYSTSGRTTSWKIGGTYAPVSDIRVRAVLARAVRAPNVGELFSPGSEGFLTVDDPCDTSNQSRTANRAANCRALGIGADYVSNARTINIRTSTSGNQALDVETADTLTAGAVLTPSFMPGVSITADYFRIKIKDAINVFAAQDILNNCVDLDSIDNAFCSSINRDASGDIAQVRRQNINVSRLDREGVDIELRYRHDLGRFGTLNVNLLGSHTITATTVVAPGTLTGGSVIDFNGEFGYPKWKGRFSTNWKIGGFDWTGTLNYLSGMQRDVQPTNPEDIRATLRTSDYFLFNTQIGYDLDRDKRFFFGVDNLFDRLPPNLPDTRIGGAGSAVGVEVFSVTGRYFYSGVRLKF